jgi:diguanylate cyclase (GGDEF)-like protein
MINETTGEPVTDPVTRCLASNQAISREDYTTLINRHDHQYAVEVSAAPIHDRNRRILGAVLVFHDVTEQRRLTREISYQASHDMLTGLLNRREFERRLQRVIDTTQDEYSHHVLCYLDLDQFKMVNDTSGHAAGDELLRQVTGLFRKNRRQRDTLARLGGDEFGLLFEHCSLEQAQLTAEKLRLELEEFLFVWENQSFRVSVSIGLVPVNAVSGNLDEILQTADSACYVAKKAGRNRVQIYSAEGDLAVARHHGELRWISRINDALAEDRFTLFVQRIVPLASKPEGTAQKQYCELLLRLIDSGGQMIEPDIFMPVAERYQLCSRIDRWVIDHAFHWLAGHPQYLQQLELCAINLSGHSLSDQTFQDHVLAQLDAFALPGARICFEITETAAIANLTHATRFIKTLRTRGCRFSLDDFGSGLSSFAYLKNLPVDFLKIDGLFVKDIADDPIDRAMVRSINEIAQLMGKQTIAEYVENTTILQHLRELGIDYAQGFGIDQPQPLEP